MCPSNYFFRDLFLSTTDRNEVHVPATYRPWRNETGMKKTALALLLAFTMLPATTFAQVVVRIGPPAPIVERRGPPPGRGYIWVDGYQNYVGDHYAWVHGYWARPPRPGAHWVAHHWVHRHGGWVLIQGHWR